MREPGDPEGMSPAVARHWLPSDSKDLQRPEGLVSFNLSPAVIFTSTVLRRAGILHDVDATEKRIAGGGKALIAKQFDHGATASPKARYQHQAHSCKEAIALFF